MLEGGAPELEFEPLLGTDESTIDSKGRILISKKKRDRLGEDFVVALGDVGCLCAYPKARWRDLVREIMQYDPINQGRQQYTRLVLGTADDDLDCDAQGRVVVPARLRKLAELENEVVIVGCGDRLEIWGKLQWAEYNKYPETYGQQRRQAIEKAYNLMVGR
jgi:MraZ protein